MGVAFRVRDVEGAQQSAAGGPSESAARSKPGPTGNAQFQCLTREAERSK